LPPNGAIALGAPERILVPRPAARMIAVLAIETIG
jgi:hypothetical protein